MEISAKGRYAVRVMAEIARNGENFVSVSEVATSQDISVKYLEKILSLLKKATLVESERGANGGYRLARSAKECSVRDILQATGDGVNLSKCSAETCPLSEKCDSKGIWSTLDELVNNFLASVTLQDLLDKANGGLAKKAFEA